MPPLPADSIHARACKLKCEKILTRPVVQLSIKAVFHELGNRLFEQALDVVHTADVRHLQQLSDLFPAGIFFRCAFLSCHNKTSTVVLLLYTTLEVYTKYGMVSYHSLISSTGLNINDPITVIPSLS